MSSLSPEQYATQQSQSPSEGGTAMNLDILKNLTEKRSTRDGNAPKKRGPKPDSKPALTRRQELNRQAQRTHRERKELYIRALEDEVLRLKEIYSTVSQDREKLAEENRLLKEALVQSGIELPSLGNLDRSGGPDGANTFGGNTNGPSSFGTGPSNTFSPGGASQSTAPSTSPGQSQGGYNALSAGQVQDIIQKSSASGLDIEQVGIDFVLALEHPCMVHIPFVMDYCTENQNTPRGHALMASCPSAPVKKLEDSLWGQSHTHDAPTSDGSTQGTWEINKADLSTLLELSSHLDLNGEITPVMAWGMLMSHPQFAELTQSDFVKIAAELKQKVRCFGFGAVMEEFELRDAFESVHSNRIEQAAY